MSCSASALSPSRKLKIAQVATVDLSVRLLLMEQLRALIAAGHSVTAICSATGMIEEIRAAGVAVEVISMRREPSPLDDSRAMLALAKYFRREQFDVVHSHTPKAGLLAPFAARIAGVPMIVHTIHGLLFHDKQPRWRQAFRWIPEKFTALNCHRLLSQSQEDLATAITRKLCREERVQYLGNGVDVEKFSPPSPLERERARRALGIGSSEFVVGSAGRLVYEKGFGEFFSAAERLRLRNSSTRFLIAGAQDSDQSDAIPQHRLQQLETAGTIRFLGWREAMRNFYAALDVFVLASHREGVPRACMEAAACGIAVVATDIRGSREVVKDGETGVLVPVGNSKHLVNAIESLMADRSRLRSYGENGRMHILDKFDQRQVIARLCGFYEELAAQRAKGAWQ